MPNFDRISAADVRGVSVLKLTLKYKENLLIENILLISSQQVLTCFRIYY